MQKLQGPSVPTVFLYYLREQKFFPRVLFSGGQPAGGHWAMCGHLPAVSLFSMEREALTSEHVVIQLVSHGLQHAGLLCPPPSLGIF